MGLALPVGMPVPLLGTTAELAQSVSERDTITLGAFLVLLLLLPGGDFCFALGSRGGSQGERPRGGGVAAALLESEPEHFSPRLLRAGLVEPTLS